MTAKQSGNTPFEFIHREDLHVLPGNTTESEINLHGGFARASVPGTGAVDRRVESNYIFYGMPGCGILRIDPDLKRQTLIHLPEKLKPMNFHSTKIGPIGGEMRLFLPANGDALVAVLDLEGKLDFILTRPEFEQYRDPAVPFAPTDTTLIGDRLFVADGYGANYITAADVHTRLWQEIFGGKTEDPHEDGRFSTAHGINVHPEHRHLLTIADRPNARIQIHGLDGSFVGSHSLPPGSWPCGIDFLYREGRWLAVIGSLVDPVKDRPAPIYIVDTATYQVLSTIRPKEDLGIDAVQHLHNVVWHEQDDHLYLICQSWNPGYYFVLERVEK